MIVVDASVVVELLLQTAAAPAIRDRVFSGDEALHAPALMDIEVAQVMRRYTDRGELAAARGRVALDLLRQLPIDRHDHRALLARIWSLRANLTAYDAAYVALAEALGATLVTRDSRLAKATGARTRVDVI